MDVGCGRILAWELRYSMVDGNRDAKRKWDEVLPEVRALSKTKGLEMKKRKSVACAWRSRYGI